MEGAGMPSLGLQLGLSSSSTSSGASGVGGTHTGPFNFGMKQAGWHDYLPLLAIAGVAWVLLKK